MTPATGESRLANLPLPSRKDEAYRFGRVREWDPLSSARVWKKAAPEVFLGTPVGASPSNEPKALITLTLSAQGVALSEPLPSGVELWVAHEAGEPQSFEGDRYALAAVECSQLNLGLRIAPGVSVSPRLRVLREGSTLGCSTFQLEVGDRAEVEVCEEVSGDASSEDHLSLSHWKIGRGAVVRGMGWIYGFQGGYQVQRREISLLEGAQVSWLEFQASGGKSQLRMEVLAQEPRAGFTLAGASHVRGTQEVDLWVSARHLAPDTQTEVLYWTVAEDQSRFVFNGNVLIPQGSVRSDAVQKNFSLLLSAQATIDALPKLEIDCDDVKCAHGASVSPVPSDQVYYLQSRGIPKADAERMIIRGFTQLPLQKISDEGLRQQVLASLTPHSPMSGEFA